MATRVQVLLPIGVAVVIVGVAGILNIPEDAKLEAVEFPRGSVALDGKVLEVQIADTDLRRKSGLMFQEQLPYDQGMLFIFDELGSYSMWMRNMQFPLDMIWFDADGKVVHIEEDVPPCKTALETATCPSTGTNKEALYILEVTAGYVAEFGVTEDSVLDLISI